MQIIRFVFTCIVALSAITVSAASFDRVVIFGDSLSDTGANGLLDSGNNFFERTASDKGAPITNYDFTLGGAWLWDNDFVKSEKLLDGKLYPAYKINNKYDNKNLNYAFASAETGDNYLDDLKKAKYPPYVNCDHAGKGCVPGVLKQISFYLAQNKVRPDTLYIIWAGGNDIFNNIYKLPKPKGKISGLISLEKMMKDTISLHPSNGSPYAHPVVNLTRAVTTLHKQGAKNILVVGMPNIAKAPAAVKMLQNNRIVMAMITMWMKFYNHRLQQQVKGMAMFYNPSAIFNEITSNKQFGTAKQQFYYKAGETCFGVYGRRRDACLQQIAQDSLPIVFYNGKHPTVRTGMALSEDMIDYLSTK